MRNKALTVGTYSDGNLLVVYDMRRQVLPTAPSPTTTHLIVCILFHCNNNTSQPILHCPIKQLLLASGGIRITEHLLVLKYIHKLNFYIYLSVL